jgi:hypothetical protein
MLSMLYPVFIDDIDLDLTLKGEYYLGVLAKLY